MLFDTHAHYDDERFDEDRDALLSSMPTNNVGLILNPGCDVDTSRKAVSYAQKYSFVYAAVGIHPENIDENWNNDLAVIKELAQSEPKVRAIGEIGLDFHYDHSPRDVQREWFRRQIRLANELKMPIAIHSREADQEVLDILKEEGAFSDERKSWFPERPDTTGYVSKQPGTCKDARVLLHCFSGSAELGSQYVKLGATISIAGPVTYKNNRKTVGVVAELPLDFLLVETDSPYLTPEPFRGKKNDPSKVEYTARKVAEIKGLSLEEVAAKTKENAMRFYGITE